MRIKLVCTLTVLLGAIGAGGIGSGMSRAKTVSTAHADDDIDASNPASFEDQAQVGADVFGEYCAKCHGDKGQGTNKAPRLVGLDKGALPLKAPSSRKGRHEDFVTVGDVARFAMKNMPADNPGSLSDDEYLAVVAFDLKANGVTLDQPLTLDLADKLTIPR